MVTPENPNAFVRSHFDEVIKVAEADALLNRIRELETEVDEYAKAIKVSRNIASNEMARRNQICKIAREALFDIEMAPRVFNKDELALKMQELARRAIEKTDLFLKDNK